jgi:hypothetical protein
VGLERLELHVPVGLQLIEERLHGNERARTKSEDPSTRIVGDALIGHHADLEEHLEVPAHGRAGAVGVGGELAGAARPLTEESENFPSGRVGECSEYIH